MPRSSTASSKAFSASSRPPPLPEIIFTRDTRRFVASMDGEEVAFSEVDLIGGTALLVKHTEVVTAHEGKGVGGALVRHMLDEARREQKSVIPICPFAAGYIQRHPEYLDVVREDYRLRLSPK